METLISSTVPQEAREGFAVLAVEAHAVGKVGAPHLGRNSTREWAGLESLGPSGVRMMTYTYTFNYQINLVCVASLRLLYGA